MPSTFGQTFVPQTRPVQVTEYADEIVVDLTDGFTFKIRKGTAGYAEIWLNGNLLIEDARWILQKLHQPSGKWRQIGDPRSVSREQPEVHRVYVKRFYDDFEGTTFEVVYDFYGGYRPKICLKADIAQAGTYRVVWSLSGIAKQYIAHQSDKKRVEIWSDGDEETKDFNYIDIFRKFRDIITVEIEEKANDHKIDFIFTLGFLEAGTFTLDPTFGNTNSGSNWQSFEGYIYGAKGTGAVGKALSIHVYVKVDTAAHQVRCALYRVSDDALIGTTEKRDLSVGGGRWEKFDFPSPVTIAAVEYWVSAWGEQTTGSVSLPNPYTVGSELSAYDWRNTSPNGFPNPCPWGDGFQDNYWHSIYCTYETIPAAPSSCTSYYQATNQTRCGWNDNSSNEDGFRIERDQDGAGFAFWKNVGIGVETSGWETRGADHRIRYRVRAYNEAGNSGWSTSGYTYTIPDPPTSQVCIYGATNNTKCQWSDQSAYELLFRIERDEDGAGFTLWKTVGAGVEDSAWEGRGADHKVRYRIRSERGALVSAWATTDYRYTIPAPPTGCTAVLDANQSSHATWTDQSTYEQRFKLEYAMGAGWTHHEYPAAEAETGSVKSIGQNQYVWWRVRAERTSPDALVSAYSTSHKIFFAGVEDTIETSDALTKVTAFKKTLEDSIEMTDAITKAAALKKLLEDTATVEDVLTRVSSFKKLFEDGVEVSDTLQKVVSFKKLLEDTIEVSSALTIIKIYFVLLEDAIEVSDALTKVASFKKLLQDTINTSDELAKTTAFHKILTDTIESISALTTKLTAKPLEDAIEVSSALTKIASFKKTLQDLVEVSDTLTKITSFKKELTDTIEASDELTKTTAFSKTLNDQILVVDELVKVSTFHKLLTDQITVEDWLELRLLLIAATIKLLLARKTRTLTLVDKSKLLKLADKLSDLSLVDKEAIIKLVNKTLELSEGNE